MDTYRKSPFVKTSLLVFAGLPLLLWILGGFPDRSLLKETLSVVTMLGFFFMFGMLAWVLLLTLGITALMRNRLPMTDNTWRRWHGILAVVFMAAGAWHAIDLGRHSSLAMSVLIILLTLAGVRLWLKNFISKKSQKPRIDR